MNTFNNELSYVIQEYHLLKELYKYYEKNKNAPLFNFNIMVYGSQQAIDSVSTRIYGQLSGINNQAANMKFIEILPMLLNNLAYLKY